MSEATGGGPAVVIERLLERAGRGQLGDLGWSPLREGVEIHRLWGDGPGAALLRYAPGAEVPLHEHRGWEQILVLDGWQVDDRRRYDAGTLFVHQPGSRHAVRAPEGCLVLAVWQDGVQLIDADADSGRFTPY